MTLLDGDVVRAVAGQNDPGRIADVQTFAEIESTNSFLMQQPAPEAGRSHIVATMNQTAGRGRHGKIWQSPAGSGLCISVAYTFAVAPENLPALTLAIGSRAIDALADAGFKGVEIKWPNDLVFDNGKLAGILTEVRESSGQSVSVVCGIGINVDLPQRLDFGDETDWARKVVDLKEISEPLPDRSELAGQIVANIIAAFVDYEASGLSPTVASWPKRDWLLGRDITIDTFSAQLSGIGAGIDDDGALLVDTPEAGIRRVTSGTIVIAGNRTDSQ